MQLGALAHIAGEFAAVGAEPDDVEGELLAGDALGGERVRRVAEDEHALAGEIGRIDRARVPGQPRGVVERRGRSSPLSAATSAMKSRVAPTPIGTVLVYGWPCAFSRYCAAGSAISG